MNKVEFINIESYCIHHPVGMNLTHNLTIIQSMQKALLKVYSYSDKICFWARGSSGAIIAGVLANNFPNSVIRYVRKKEEKGHHHVNRLNLHEFTNIIVDDFMDSGKTIRAIYKEAKENSIKIDCICMSGRIQGEEFPIPRILIGGSFCIDDQNYLESGIIEY